eukprot:TRINITY_DN4113_c0_g2_i14.p3 TRINITY_DN4113_c0_g2~~TRINITY_DN4113_c0_g2_i14.p3  ORF type:complete len:119 (+),score=24.68 TRINITY_DN4113_c0_g2_i14:92-448(+)
MPQYLMYWWERNLTREMEAVVSTQSTGPNYVFCWKLMSLYLVFGGTGYIGSHIIQTLQEKNLELVVGRSRLECRQELYAEIESVSPTHVICAAGIKGKPNVDWFEIPENYPEAYDINV